MKVYRRSAQCQVVPTNASRDREFACDHDKSYPSSAGRQQGGFRYGRGCDFLAGLDFSQYGQVGLPDPEFSFSRFSLRTEVVPNVSLTRGLQVK
jgi:hypothetical protein